MLLSCISCLVYNACFLYITDNCERYIEIIPDSKLVQTTENYDQSKELPEMGLQNADKWRVCKVMQNNLNGDKSPSGVIVISNAFTDNGQLRWSLR